MKHGRLAWVALVGAAASASAASAQITANQMIQGRQARSVLIIGSAGVEYDTNVARISPGLAAQQGLQLEDTLYTPTIDADVVLPVGRQALFLKGLVGYVGHVENTQLDHTRVDIAGGIGNRLGPCGSVLTAGYFRGRSELQNLTLATTVQDLQQIKRLDFSVTCVRPPGIGVYVDVSRSWATNSVPATTNGNYVTTAVSGGLTYQRASTGSISLTAADAKTDYSQDGLLAIGPSGFESRSVGLSLERRLGGRIQATAAVSYTTADIERGTAANPTGTVATNFKGLTYSGDVTFRASSRLSARAGFERDVKPSLIPGGSFEVDTSYDVGLTYNLGSRIQLAASDEKRNVAVHGDFLLPAITLTEAHTNVFEASARYSLTKRLSFVLTGRHESRDANNPLFEYDNNSIGLAADVRF